MVNKVILIGRLGRDPETRETNSGMTVAELRIATSRGRGDNEQTDWHTVVCFDKTAEIVAKYLSKGRQVYVEGRLQHDSWEDKDGNKKYKTSVVANSVQFLGSRSEAESGGGNYSRSSEKRQRSSDDEVIPF
jgi:single-strand DNA-binding protein